MHVKHLISAIFALIFLLGNAGAGGTITKISSNGSTLVLTVRALQSEQYQLQCSTNLMTGAWQDIGEAFFAVSAETNLTVGLEADNCYFRVREERPEPTGPTGPPGPPPPPPAG